MISGLGFQLTSSHDEQVIIRTAGTDVTLNCTLVDDDGASVSVPRPTIAWYFNNIPTSSTGDGRLELRNVQLTHMGWYTCAASTNTEKFELDFLLVIGGEHWSVIYSRGV